jgi:glycosyltransferase involved in cell wall biosynthesis
MKILYHHRTSAQDGGAVHIDSLIQALRDLGAEVVLVAPPMAAAAPGQPCRHKRLVALRKRLPRVVHEIAELAYNLPEAWRLWRAVRQYRPAVIYERSNLFLLSGSWVARRMKIPLISEVNAPYSRERLLHGGLALQRMGRWAERHAWRKADALVAVTGVLAETITESGVPPEKLHVMPNGIDSRVFAPEAIVASAKDRLGLAGYTVLGFTGYVRDWNGLDTVVDLLADARGGRLFLLVVGDGPARSSLEARAQKLGVADRLRFTGIVPREHIAAHVSAFDIALLPAANPYASPLKLFEYMALGRAIVAPDQPNIREILRDGHDACLFSSGDAASMRAAVLSLAGDENLRRALERGAIETLNRRKLTWRQNAERLLELAGQLQPTVPRARLGIPNA